MRIFGSAIGCSGNIAEIMTSLTMYTSLKAVGYVVILSMIGTLVFAGYVALTHWSGIGV